MTRIELVAVFIVALLCDNRVAAMELVMPDPEALHELRRIPNSTKLDRFLKDLAILEDAKLIRRKSFTPPPRRKQSIEEFLKDLDALEEARELRRRKRSIEQLKNFD